MKEQCFLVSGVLTKQLWSWRKGMGVERERAGWGGGGQESKVSVRSEGWGRPGEQGQCRELTQSELQHQMLGKMPLIKKAHEKISCPRAGFNDRHKPPG
jgi:hypothetical protein